MRVCVVGACGHVRQALDTIRARGDAEIVGAAAEGPYEEAAAIAALGAKVFPDWRAMLDCEKPDLAVVSPVFAHTGRVIMECAERGIDVFAEKPLAASEAELSEVEAAVRENGIRFCAMHYLRYDPAFYHGARLVREGAIGDVRMVTAQKSYRYGKRPAFYGDMALYGGTIPWVGIHAIDWIYHFTGKRFLSVTANSIGKNPEMAAICQFGMEGGLLASLNLDYYRPSGAPTHGDDRIRCVGTRGILEVRDGRILLTDADTATEITPDRAPDLLADFLDGKEPIAPQELFYLTRVAIAARDSAERGEPREIGGYPTPR